MIHLRLVMVPFGVVLVTCYLIHPWPHLSCLVSAELQKQVPEEKLEMENFKPVTEYTQQGPAYRQTEPQAKFNHHHHLHHVHYYGPYPDEQKLRPYYEDPEPQILYDWK